MALFSDTFYDTLDLITENKNFLIIFYSIFAVALFVYLYTGMLICQRSRCTPQQGCCKVQAEAGNWLIRTQMQYSPLNLNETCQRQCKLDPVIWLDHDKLPAGMLLENNGRTAVLYAKYASTQPRVSGANLPDSYDFVHLSFRWGSDCNPGSDHMIDNKKFPLEMQVMYRIVNGDDVLSSHDMLIFAFLYEFGGTNSQLEPITKQLKHVRKVCSSKAISPIPLDAIIPNSGGSFYCYIGSMAEPPFYVGVKWLVYSQPLMVDESQVHEFRQLLGPDRKRIQQVIRPVKNP